ncbi:hypothetical protein ACFV5E_44055 [Streptomyces chartreusis]|uniref:hypothetical protein n=1 Tax=Streptomyces chartreusis TaxID=1969 RepID=UPI0036A4AB4A
MSEGTWAAITSRDTVLLLAALAVYLGGAVGVGRSLPRLLRRNSAWRAATERHPLSGAVALALLIALWPASLAYLMSRVVTRQRRGR